VSSGLTRIRQLSLLPPAPQLGKQTGAGRRLSLSFYDRASGMGGGSRCLARPARRTVAGGLRPATSALALFVALFASRSAERSRVEGELTWARVDGLLRESVTHQLIGDNKPSPIT
jgi:hypothetical protein